MSIINERDKALDILAKNISNLEVIFRKGFREDGRGGLIIHTKSIVNDGFPEVISYRNQKEFLEIFSDNENSRQELSEMLSTYNPDKEGIAMLLTSFNNASFFVTFKFD